MLRNLKAEMARQKITGQEIALFLKVREATIYDKINGKYDFKFTEALAIKRQFFPNCSLEYLFEREKDVDQAVCL